jgi:uncharacterized linocin/CFP29 family protein
MNMNSAASISSAKGLMQGGGWATMKWLENMKKPGSGLAAFSSAALRTAEVLTRDEWKEFDNQIVEESQIRLRIVADLIAGNLVKRIPNGLAKTVLNYQTMSDMDDAIVSLDGVTRSMNDRPEFGDENIPLPITHKDYYLNLRTLLASRTSGEALDTTYARLASRKVSEANENMVVNGGPQFGGLPIYGLRTHPNRILGTYSGSIAWNNAAKTGAQITTDVSTAISALEARGFNGPYMVYMGSGGSLKVQEDYKAESDRTIRERVLAFDNVQGLRVLDKLPVTDVVVVQMTPDVIQLVIGEDLQTVQWDVHGGFQINFKVWDIFVPLIRSTSDSFTGIVHFSL